MTTKRRRTLPPVSPKVSAELRPLVSAIAEIIETGEGVRGDPLDRKLTLRDLLDSGIGRLRNGLPPSNPGALQPGTGAPDLSTPPKPVGFEAVAAFDGEVFLTWETPQRLYSNHALTNIYRAESDNFANAERIGQEPGMFYIDNVRADASQKTYYYWISFTSTSDIEGPTNDTSGTPVTTILSPEYIIDQIQGQISESELANELLTPIQAIPTIQSTLDDYDIRIPSLEATVGNHAIQIPSMQGLLDDYGPRIAAAEGTIVSHENDITSLSASLQSAELDIIANADAYSALDTRVVATETEIAAQAGQITSLQTSLNDLAISAFDANYVYAIGELFRYDNIVYEVVATQTAPNATPPNATYYTARPDYETIADTVSANSAAVSALDTRVTAAEGSITSQATDITLLQSDMATAQGDITSNANATSSLDTRVTTAENNITGLSGDITVLQNSLATTDGNVTTNANAINSLQTSVSSINGVITSQSTDITQLQNDLDAAELSITANAGAITSLTNRVTATEGDISSQSTQLTNLNNELTAAENGITANSQALSLLDSRVSSTEGTVASQGAAITQLQNDLDLAEQGVSGNASAINSLTTRVTSAEGSLSSVAQDVSQLQVSVGDNSAAIQTKAEVSAVQGIADDVAVLSAQYTVKLDVNGRVAGIGLANDNGVTSFVVASDSVYFIDPGQSITAFNPDTNYASMAALRNTQFVFGYATVEGQRRFAINVPAYIPELYVENAMLKDLVVTRAKIANLAVNGAKIDIADIWELNIGDEVRSVPFAAGSTGWRISRDGNAEFNNATFRGHVEADSGYIASTLQIGGTGRDFGELLQMAESADTSLFESWVRPGTTLIDGNKIFTGDAYVDTLQIKGNAVTVPDQAERTSWYYLPSSGNWHTIQTLYVLHGQSGTFPVLVVAGATGQGYSNAPTTVFGWRVNWGGTTILNGGANATSSGGEDSSAKLFNLPNGSTLSLQVFVSAFVSNDYRFKGYISTIGTKR
jgi:predicted  nucleic acid-binding Zn-ribbon protein